jgi:hypothetical protein
MCCSGILEEKKHRWLEAAWYGVGEQVVPMHGYEYLVLGILQRHGRDLPKLGMWGSMTAVQAFSCNLQPSAGSRA